MSATSLTIASMAASKLTGLVAMLLARVAGVGFTRDN